MEDYYKYIRIKPSPDNLLIIYRDGKDSFYISITYDNLVSVEQMKFRQFLLYYPLDKKEKDKIINIVKLYWVSQIKKAGSIVLLLIEYNPYRDLPEDLLFAHHYNGKFLYYKLRLKKAYIVRRSLLKNKILNSWLHFLEGKRNKLGFNRLSYLAYN